MSGQKFTHQVEAGGARIRLKLWGYWDDKDAHAYNEAMMREIELRRAAHKPWHVLVDARNSPPQSPTTQRVRQDILSKARQGGMQRIAYLVESSLTNQQMQRINADAGTNAAFFQVEADAIAWLHKT